MADILDEVVNLTESMYVAAMAAEWDELDHLQQQQAALIKQGVFETDVAGKNHEVLQKVVELTHLVIDIAETHRLQLYDELMQLKKNGNAQNAYLQNT